MLCHVVRRCVTRCDTSVFAMHTPAAVLAWGSVLCSVRLEASQAFVPSLTGTDRRFGGHSVNSPPQPPASDHLASQRRLKRPRPRLQAASAGDEGAWEGSLLEMDVVEYRKGGDDGSIELGSYIGDGKLQPLLTREESGPNLFFHDEDAQPVPVSGGSCRIVRVLDDVYFSQRIVEDRVKNPHGEEAEDCFLLEGTLNPATVIRVEHSQD